MPVFSVIVPVYNAATTLNRCVDSILSQEFSDLELLLIDDGSTDGSGVVCDDYANIDNRVRVFHKSNAGVSSARNLGLDNAVGDWIAFCDADDWTYPCWLSHFYQMMLDDVQLLVQGFRTDRPVGNGTSRTEYGVEFTGSSTDGFVKLYSQNLLGYLFVKAFKREQIESHSIRFNEAIHFNEDGLFVIDFLSQIQSIKSDSNI